MKLCGHTEFDYTCDDCVFPEPHFDTSPEQDAHQELVYAREYGDNNPADPEENWDVEKPF